MRLISASGAAGAVSAFSWSNNEQVYPLEKDYNGDTLYAKHFGIIVDSTYKSADTGVSGIKRMVRLLGTVVGSDNLHRMLQWVDVGGESYDSMLFYNAGTNQISVMSGGSNFIMNQTAHIYMIYSKN